VIDAWWQSAGGDLRSGQPVLLAVSGGSDSLALLLLAADFSKKVSVQFHAVTVDHGLRPAAATEAAQVAEICAGLGIPHQTLTLSWNDVSGVSQARARRARYAALCNFAHSTGARSILTGHTRDDQAETFMIRCRSGSGAWGLAGMALRAPAPVWPEGRGIWLERPLLFTEREGLQEFLVARGLDWVRDPSNENVVFERVRMRRLIGRRPWLKHQILALQARYTQHRTQLQAELKRWSGAHLNWHPGGTAQIEYHAFQQLDDDRAGRLLALLLPCVSGQEAGPRSVKISSVLQSVREGRASTLGGCRLFVQKSHLMIAPEDRLPAPEAMDGTTLIWKGRQIVTSAHDVRADLRLAAWGEREVSDRFRGDLPPFPIRRTWPVVIDRKDRVLSVPQLEQGALVSVEDLAPGRFAALNEQTTEFFRKESDRGESFSKPSSPML
jgi:tRNA(Ile)-lysidine synthase